jgi:hypothetical protein
MFLFLEIIAGTKRIFDKQQYKVFYSPGAQ